MYFLIFREKMTVYDIALFKAPPDDSTEKDKYASFFKNKGNQNVCENISIY